MIKPKVGRAPPWTMLAAAAAASLAIFTPTLGAASGLFTHSKAAASSPGVASADAAAAVAGEVSQALDERRYVDAPDFA